MYVYQKKKLKVLYLAPLFLMTSTVSSTKYRSLMYAKISSQISCKRERWVRLVKYKTGTISGSGKLWRFCLAFFFWLKCFLIGESRSARHSTAPHKTVAQNGSLKKVTDSKTKTKIHYLSFHKFYIKSWQRIETLLQNIIQKHTTHTKIIH